MNQSVVSENAVIETNADVPRGVRFEPNNANEDEEARLRRGTVDRELRDLIAIRAILGRNAVLQGYPSARADSNDRVLGRSQSEASPFTRGSRSAKGKLHDNPSLALWDSGYTTLSRVKSTSSVISGLNDDILRAGWRRNEPGPYWEQAHELEPDRQAIVKIDEAEGDGFDVEDMDLESPPTDSSPAADLNGLMKDGDEESLSQEAADQLADFPTAFKPHLASSRRSLAKTQSMPVGGTFGTRPEQPKYYRTFDDSFMRMDVEF